MKSREFKLDHCSDHLRALRRKFQEFEHGGIVLDSEQVQQIVDHLEEATAMALNLEYAVSNSEWNRRAAAERQQLLTKDGITVLDAFRVSNNVVLFKPKGPNHPGSAA